MFLKSKVEWWFSKKKRVNNRNRGNKQKKRSNTSKRPLLMLLVLLVWSWNSQSKYYQITKINTLKLTGHASHKDLSTIQINRRGHVYFSLPPSVYYSCSCILRTIPSSFLYTDVKKKCLIQKLTWISLRLSRLKLWILVHYNILSVKRISWKQNFWKNIWGGENDLGLRQGSPFCSTQDFSHICFVSRQNLLTGNMFYNVKQSLFHQKCINNVKTTFVSFCWLKQLTPPTFSPCISVKLKCHDSAKWVERLLWILCKSL